jgi:hypothetical protein
MIIDKKGSKKRGAALFKEIFVHIKHLSSFLFRLVLNLLFKTSQAPLGKNLKG